MKVVALAGGTGSAKLLRGLNKLPVELSVVANVGDNVWMYGVYVCPDIDIACYTLAGIADRARGWGISGDTYETLAQLSRLGYDTWFRLGDRDLAFALARTEKIRKGWKLTEVTEATRNSMGVKCRVLPVTDAPLETRVLTAKGDLHLQEFWVRDRGIPRVTGVRYGGARDAKVTRMVARAIQKADRIVICPADPITSIGPMLAVPGFTRLLSKAKAPVVALSPMTGSSPFSGPAAKLMRAMGLRHDSVGVAKLYSKFLDRMMISEDDWGLREGIESLGIRCASSDTAMRSDADELRLAKELLEV